MSRDFRKKKETRSFICLGEDPVTRRTVLREGFAWPGANRDDRYSRIALHEMENEVDFVRHKSGDRTYTFH